MRDGGLPLSPLQRARNKLLRVSSLHRTPITQLALLSGIQAFVSANKDDIYLRIGHLYWLELKPLFQTFELQDQVEIEQEIKEIRVLLDDEELVR